MLKEFSSLKTEVLALRKIPSHQTTTSHFTYPSHNRSHSKSFNQNSQNHPPTSSQLLPFFSTLRPPPGPNLTIQGRDEIFNDLCFYHQKYETTARYCVQGCTHFDKYMKTKHFQLTRQCPSINHDLQVNTINVSNALPESADKYIHLTDTHNNIVFIIDTASPKSLISSNKYTCVTNPDSCRLFAADGHPIQQSGVIELTLHFQEFPNKQFTHSFIVANILTCYSWFGFFEIAQFYN